MNNRKQKVESFLNSITIKELDDYMSNNVRNKDIISKLNKIKSTKELTHFQRIVSKIGADTQECFNQYYKLGEAYIIAFILTCYYDDKYKIKDLKYYLKSLIDNDREMKEYVYDIMKDF